MSTRVPVLSNLQYAASSIGKVVVRAGHQKVAWVVGGVSYKRKLYVDVPVVAWVLMRFLLNQ